MSEALSVTGLVKAFGATRALDGLDLVVSTGEVHGFLGPNGAGKSTTIRILLGMLRADAGTARLLGGDPWADAAELHRRLAYVPGDVTLWPNLSGGEVIDLLGRLRGGLNEQRRAELLERFDLDPRKKCRTYSKGNRQKVALIAALASDVELLAYIIALYPVLMTLRLRSEETSGRAEAVQATAVSRLRWAAGHLIVTGLGTTALMAVSGIVFGTTYSVLVGDLATDLPRFLAGALGAVPAAWCVGAVCVLAYGLLPRASAAISWVVWIVIAGFGQVVGPLYGLWGGSPLEPFHHIPNPFAVTSSGATPLLALLAVAAALLGGGLLALRRRDFG
ncbi:ATP-binding cassette domain-containing protein [Rhizohabitans arisaemae]|uniref:ATP-binding cassette domain-containing protein n=1 Tax=Rhizohabitans arisaemae TaxID=2720610 RepID=UPI0024B0CE02|nr:ATP-binding cassette domain-containing protein [Rhizohabitans arisaemae]